MKKLYTKNDIEYNTKYDKCFDSTLFKTEYEKYIEEYLGKKKNIKLSTDEILDKLDFGEIEQYVRRKKLNNINNKK